MHKCVRCKPSPHRMFLLALGSPDGSVHVWDLRKQKCLQQYKQGTPVTTAVFTPDGRSLVSGEPLSLYTSAPCYWGGSEGPHCLTPKAAVDTWCNIATPCQPSESWGQVLHPIIFFVWLMLHATCCMRHPVFLLFSSPCGSCFLRHMRSKVVCINNVTHCHASVYSENVAGVQTLVFTATDVHVQKQINSQPSAFRYHHRSPVTTVLIGDDRHARRFSFV